MDNNQANVFSNRKGGGGIANNGGTVEMIGGVLSDNQAALSGGGAFVNFANGTAVLSFVSITGNGAFSGAGVYVDSGTTTIDGCTFANNIIDPNGVGRNGAWALGAVLTPIPNNSPPGLFGLWR